jgi:lactose/L-arabinose transport system permease protein
MRRSLEAKIKVWGWLFVAPATLLIMIFSFYPMIQAFILSLQTGRGNNLRFGGIRNYVRLLEDPQFRVSVVNVFTYLIFQVPVMLILALILATLLNNTKLKGRGLWRTFVFLPCASGLVSAAIIFKSFFAPDGYFNSILMGLGLLDARFAWLANPFWAKVIVILVITWRWVGYNTIFYLAGLQNIDTQVYEAAEIDGASGPRQFFSITMPLLKPVILLTTIMSTNGTIQLFDEVKTMTNGGPGTATITISQYIYNITFLYTPQFGYSAAASYSILFMVAVLSFIQLKLGDKQ